MILKNNTAALTEEDCEYANGIAEDLLRSAREGMGWAEAEAAVVADKDFDGAAGVEVTWDHGGGRALSVVFSPDHLRKMQSRFVFSPGVVQ